MKKIECYFTADIAFSSPVCLAYCVIEFKDIHKHYCKMVTGGLWLSYLWGYVNVSQLGQSDLNPGNCSENNINMYTLKKYTKIQYPKPHCSFVLWHFWTIVLYYSVFKWHFILLPRGVGGGISFLLHI